jgi:hypothetical protein
MGEGECEMSNTERVAFACVGALVALVVMAIMATERARDRVSELGQEAIQLGFAQYNPTNGVWEWRSGDETITNYVAVIQTNHVSNYKDGMVAGMRIGFLVHAQGRNIEEFIDETKSEWAKEDAK